MKYRNYLSLAVAVSLSFLLYSCGEKPVNNGSAAKNIEPLSCLVILPTQTPYQQTEGTAVVQGELQAGAEFLDRLLPLELQKSKVSRIVETSQLRLSGDAAGGKGSLREIGEKSGCNTILITTLSNFRERQGSELAVDSPASAAFEIQLIAADSGHSLWMTNFNETQSSLMENLFSFSKAKSRGFKWITVKELATQGLREKLIECPYLY